MDINSILKNHNIDAINDNEKVIDRLVAKNIKEYKSEIKNNITNIINKNIIENQNKPNGTIQLDKEGKIPSELLPNNLSNQQFEELNKKLDNLRISGGTDWSEYTTDIIKNTTRNADYITILEVNGDGVLKSIYHSIFTPNEYGSQHYHSSLRITIDGVVKEINEILDGNNNGNRFASLTFNSIFKNLKIEHKTEASALPCSTVVLYGLKK